MTYGETKTYGGYEVCLFPMNVLDCTQVPRPGAYTHCCGTATDWVGQSGTNDPIFAPFTCTRVFSGTFANGNTRAYLSDSPVWTPSGLCQVLVAFTHDDNPPVQSHFTQGEIIAHTGTAGYATGDHLHLDQSFTSTYVLIDSGIQCTSQRECWQLDGGVLPQNVYYLSGSETIIDTQGLTFKSFTKNTVLLLLMAKRKKDESTYLL